MIREEYVYRDIHILAEALAPQGVCNVYMKYADYQNIIESMSYKHLFFDIDGILVDNEKAVNATWQETILQLFGHNASREEKAKAQKPPVTPSQLAAMGANNL